MPEWGPAKTSSRKQQAQSKVTGTRPQWHILGLIPSTASLPGRFVYHAKEKLTTW